MKKNPRKTAEQVLKALGGKDNITHITHCATRLRLELKDESLINKDSILDADGVAGYFEKSGQHQVILGTGYVNKVCSELQQMTSIGNLSTDTLGNENESNKLSFQKITKNISDIFIPIIPVLLATGILMGLQGLLVNGLGMKISDNVNAIFSILTGTAYTFIPVLVCWSACKKYGGSPIIGIVLGLMLVSPILPNKWDVVNGLTDPIHFTIGSFNLNITGYQSSVLPALFMGIFVALLEKKLSKIIPDIVHMLLVPFLTLLISLILGLFVVGPILAGIEKALTDFVLYMLNVPYGIGGIVYGGGIQLLCVVGMHHTVTPIIVSIFTQTGLDYINPLGSAAIAGQLGAGLALVMLQKNKNTRLKMIPALIPALFGISEPVMYGLTLPKIKPFFMGCLGGAAGGAFAGITQLAAKGTGASMLPGALLFLDGGLISYILVLIISIGVAYIGTVFVMTREGKKSKKMIVKSVQKQFNKIKEESERMQLIDFSNRQNRFIPMKNISKDYVEHIRKTTKKDPYYPTYHIAPPHGLLNDPNGLYQDDYGYFHIFYQWFPLGPVHGLKYWYHLTTKDFVYYNDFGSGISPEDAFDSQGCYSGMTLKEGENVHIYYPGIRLEGEEKVPSTVYAKINKDKVNKEGIIVDLDPTVTTTNYRDPFVFKKNEKYYLLVGGENHQNNGILLMYEGKTPTDFEYVGNLKIMDYSYGYMLECPNYFEEENTGVLVFSAQGIKSPNKYDFRNVFPVIYAVGGPINTETRAFSHDTFYELDKGFDFYAPQIFQDNSGRRILYGWLGNSKCEYPTDKNNWAHMLTIPREVSIEGDRIIQWPIKELQKLRHEKSVLISKQPLKNRSFELSFEATESFEITISNKKGEKLIFKGTPEEYILNRGKTTTLYNDKYGQERYAKRLVRDKQQGCIYVDNSSIEVFVDNGMTVFTGRFFLEKFNQIEISGTRGEIYYLRPIQLDDKTLRYLGEE